MIPQQIELYYMLLGHINLGKYNSELGRNLD